MARVGHRFQVRNLTPAQSLLEGGAQLLDRHGVGQIPFVELENKGQVVQVLAVFRKILSQVCQRLEVGFEHVRGRIGYEDHPVGAS
jgi:hypothetical protein